MRREMKGLGFLETAHRDDRAQMGAWVRAGQRREPRSAGPGHKDAEWRRGELRPFGTLSFQVQSTLRASER